MRGRKKVFHANGNKKKAGVKIPTSDKIDLKTRTITKDKEEHHIMIRDQANKKTKQL